MGQTIAFLRAVYDDVRLPKPKFIVDDIPDLSGKIVIVTGGYTGIGLETVRALLKKNATVYIAGRNRAKADSAIADLHKDTGKEAIFLELDLASLKSVKKAAEEFMSKETQLHILFNNGGVMYPPIEQLTADGYDLQFGTNVLGHFYFTQLLIPVLLETARASSDSHVRVVTTSSLGHMMHASSNILYDTLRDSPERKEFDTFNLYYQSKFGNVLIARELARRYGDQGVVSMSVHPGIIGTELGRNLSWIKQKTYGLIVYPPPFGALTQLYAGTSPEARDLNGAYLIPWARVAECRKDARDPKTAEELWKWCEEQVKDI
ncbi:NAD-binding protein [Fomitiporia mediterranea MF3/22]|uniref:NAD-binding protein n=1 Tax=Fomitiporia mediterranea (strain MF3/22) TaxID=694068 RepID=UPI0004408935|nr:NAD-binding protein [Fomitiporia mediterranea MF3/22]EJD04776.1 NAD-binding protein [Fomitiporia mediterranea MF3/22]